MAYLISNNEGLSRLYRRMAIADSIIKAAYSIAFSFEVDKSRNVIARLKRR